MRQDQQKNKRRSAYGRYNRGCKRKKAHRLNKDKSSEQSSNRNLFPNRISIPTPKSVTVADHDKAEDVSIEVFIAIYDTDAAWFGKKKARESRNYAIAYSYKYEFMSPAPEEWYDKGGIVETLVKRFRIPSKKKRNVVRVLRELQECRSLDIPYPRQNNKGGRPALIQEGSEDEKIIAN